MQTKGILFLILCLFLLHKSYAQPAVRLSLQEILHMGESNYPLLKSKAFEVDAAKKTVETSKNTNIPSLDASYQINYATHNNITGMLYPQFVLPISGPPSSTNDLSAVFGTATSLLLNWQPITFGQREAQTAYAEAGVSYAASDAANEIFQYKVKLINAYLDALTIKELIKVYDENLIRSQTNLSEVKILVLNGIKPGVDTALFFSEQSKAKIDLLSIKKNNEQAMIVLTQLLASKENISIGDSSFFNQVPQYFVVADTIKHPLQSLYTSSIELDKAKRKALTKTTAPMLNVWGTTYARGSGISYDGMINSFDGLGLQRINYGVGVQLSLPLLQSLRIKSHVQQEDLLIKADEERLNGINLQLSKQLQTADTTLQYALQVVKESYPLLQSSDYVYKTILSRYHAGLANYADVVQAQYNLVKAKVDYKTTYMAVWKALLYKAAVTGNINLFLNQVK